MVEEEGDDDCVMGTSLLMICSVSTSFATQPYKQQKIREDEITPNHQYTLSQSLNQFYPFISYYLSRSTLFHTTKLRNFFVNSSS